MSADEYGFYEYELCADGTIMIDGELFEVAPEVYNLLACQHDFIHERVLFVEGVDEEDIEEMSEAVH